MHLQDEQKLAKYRIVMQEGGQLIREVIKAGTPTYETEKKYRELVKQKEHLEEDFEAAGINYEEDEEIAGKK